MNQKFKKALIFINGDETDITYIRQYIDKDTLLVGCDGGTDRIYDLNLTPHVVIGDFDSIRNLPGEIRNLPSKKNGKEIDVGNTTYVRYPTDKDFLDAEAAIDYAAGKGMDKIILVNTDGNELDHVIGVLIVIAKNKYKMVDIKIIRARQTIYVVRNKAVIKGKKGDKISLIPLYGPVKVHKSSGLKYDPSEHQMSLQHNIGISNEMTDKEAVLNISKGCFLVVHYNG